MLRLVADTNVYVSAAISSAGSSMAIIEAARRREAVLVMCEALHAEIAGVLERERFRRWITFDEAADFLAAVALLAEWVDDRPPTEIPKVCDDPDDDFLIALCQDADTNILISGDRAVRRVKYPNILVYSPAEGLELLSFHHEWGEGFIPSDFETSQRQMDAEGSTALVTAYASFAAVFAHAAATPEDAQYLLQFITVPSAIPPFIDAFDQVREMLRDRGVGTRPYFIAPEVAYLKLTPDPKEHLVTTGECRCLPVRFSRRFSDAPTWRTSPSYQSTIGGCSASGNRGHSIKYRRDRPTNARCFEVPRE